MWLVHIAESEFLWGTILGILLSVVAAKAGLYFQRKDQEARVESFATDLIRNTRDYVSLLSETRDRTGVIYIDVIALIENEIGIWGRNREHLFLIRDDEARKELRDFFSKAAKLSVDVRASLGAFVESTRIADAASEPEGGGNRKLAASQLLSAQKACDRLIDHVRTPIKGWP